MADLARLIAGLDPDPGRRGRQFEHVCQWFLRNDPLYAHELAQVWLWDEWPGRWGADAGIDLVAEDRQGHRWAVQAKAYDPTHTVTKRDVDTFLSESARPEFDFRLLIATTNLIGRTAKRTLEAQEKQASVLLLGDLEVAAVDWPTSVTQLRARPRRPNQPRPHQREAMTAVVRGFESADRGQMIMACGTGKTLTALFINEKLRADRTLVLVPSLSLLAQTLREWTANSKVGFDFLPVCSDETVADPDAAVASTSDLGFPVTTSPIEIATFLRRRSRPRVVFASYQSSPRIAEAFRLSRVPGFDLVIADEAHRCAGRISSDFATVLDPDAIKARRRLFMTATPRYFTGRVLKEAKVADFEVASMDEEGVFGSVFHRLGFAEAIKRELLTDYQVVVVGVDDATYRDWAERGRFVTMDGSTVTDARSLAGQIGLAKAMRRYDLHRTISFHSRVSRASKFAQSMPEVIDWMPARQRPKGRLWSDYVSGEMPAGSRAVRIDQLRHLDSQERGLLANARCLAEGVDVPALDGVAFIDPRRSEVDIVQAVGRAIRLAENKVVGTIVIPVFIEANDDPEVALDRSMFKPVWDVVKALRAHDDELGQQLDQLRRELGRRNHELRLPAKIHLDLPARIGHDFANAFDVHLVDHTTASWEHWYGLLERYVEREGHAGVPKAHIEHDYRLGYWVSNQRAAYKAGRLNPNRATRLEALPGWTYDPIAIQWEEGFGYLLSFVKREGHTRVFRAHVEDGYRLGLWVNDQRADYRAGRLDPERAARLEALPGWTYDPIAIQWEEGFGYLRSFVKREGDTKVPQGRVEDGFQLGTWVHTQRTAYRHGRLDREAVVRLEALPGWTWEPGMDRWEKGFAHLVDYVQREGHARVPDRFMEDRYRLGQWVGMQRGSRAKGKLEHERGARLEALPGWTWEPHTDRWEAGFGYLGLFFEREGHTRVPTLHIEESYPLGTWVNAQRNAYRNGTLDSDRAARLEALPGWAWNQIADQWEEGFSHLLSFVDREGDSRVPQSLVEDGYRLGKWASKQRVAYRKGTLDSDRAARLEALPGWAWNQIADQWEEGFSHLLSFVDREGDSRVPQSLVEDGYRLGKWASKQRVAYRKGTLDSDRAARLEALPGWAWNQIADQWEEGFSHLLSFVDREGDSRVPQSLVEDGYRLGKWASKQRVAYRKGTLDSDRAARLEALPAWVWNAGRT